jgi:hypothetical protein
MPSVTGRAEMGPDAPRSRQEPSPAVTRGRTAGGQTGKRERLEDRALAALLSQPTIAQAAAVAGISESTLARWLAEPSFRARYREARRLVVEQAISTLQQATSEAAEALQRNLTCGVPAAEISAAKTILDQAFRGMEVIDLAAEVAELKRQLDGSSE